MNQTMLTVNADEAKIPELLDRKKTDCNGFWGHKELR